MQKSKKIEFIKENKDIYGLKILLEITQLKRSYWDKYKDYNFKKQDFEALINIVKVFNENRSQFGYRQINKYLRMDYGIVYNSKKIYRIMKENYIQAEYVRKMRRKIKVRQHNKKTSTIYPDLINRNFKDIKQRFTVLYTDVTYLIWNGQKHYQSTIIDGYTKEPIDTKWGKYNDNKLVMDNLRDALIKIKKIKSDLKGVIIHSDHGYQYTSKIYQDKCISEGIIISMGKNYHCADNVVIESFHALLKKGTIHNNYYFSLEEYIKDVKEWNFWYQIKKIKDIINM